MKLLRTFFNKHFLSWIVCAIGFCFYGCGEDDFVEPVVADPQLTVSVVANDPVTKDIITAGFLDDNSEIGVAMYNEDLGAESGVSYHYHNVKFTAAGTAENQVWNPEQPIYLGETVGTAYAYYPYNESVTNVEEIPVTTVGQTDYLYAKQENLSSAATSATFPMNHGLAVVSLKVVRGSYPGVGLLSKAEVRGPGICTAGKLNAKTGELHSFVGKADPVAVASDVTINSEGDIVDLIVVPNGETGAFRITLTIDGVEYITATSEIKLEAGCRYHYTVTANERQVVLSAVSIGDWGYNDAGDPTILVGGYSITLAGDLTGLAFNSVVSGSTVTIEARPKTAFWVPVSITASEGVTMTQQVASDGLITLNLSEITANIVVTFVGYKISVAGTVSDFTFSNSISGSTVTIVARPKSGLWVPYSITASSGCTLSNSWSTEGLITVNLSDITADIVVTYSCYKVTFNQTYANCVMSAPTINSSKVISFTVTPITNFWVPNISRSGSGTLSQSIASDGKVAVTLSGVSSNTTVTIGGYSITYSSNFDKYVLTETINSSKQVTITGAKKSVASVSSNFFAKSVSKSGTATMSSDLSNGLSITLSSVSSNIVLSLTGYTVTVSSSSNVPVANIKATNYFESLMWIVNCPYSLGTNEHWVPYVTHSGTSSISTAMTGETQYQTILSNITSNETLTLNGYKVSAGGDLSNLTVTSSNNNGVVTYVVSSIVSGKHPCLMAIPIDYTLNSTFDASTNGNTYVVSDISSDVILPFACVESVYTWSVQSGTWNNSSSSSSVDGNYYTCVSPGTSKSTVLRCTFVGVSSITFTCRYQSDSESNYDYLTIGSMDASCTRDSYGTSLKGTTGKWKDITFTCDGGEHFVEFCYSKDNVYDGSPDNAEVYISAVTY